MDLETLAPKRDLELGPRYEIRLPMMWIALLRGRVKASLAATRGVEGPEEVVKYLLAGADAVMTTSALLRRGRSTCARWSRGWSTGCRRTATPRPTRCAAC